MSKKAKPKQKTPLQRGRPRTSDAGKLLSNREEEVLNHLKEGKQYLEIAEILFISHNTVKRHTQQIYRKLKVKNRTEAINRFYESH